MSRSIKAVFAVLVMTLSGIAWAEGKIAVVNFENAIMQTDLMQKRMIEMQNEAEFKTNMAEFERLKTEYQELREKFQKDAVTMSQEQQVTATQKLASKEGDLKHLQNKLEMAQRSVMQSAAVEMRPKLDAAVAELVAAEGIGLLLNQNAVAYATPDYDITDKVTDKLNQAAAK